MLVIGPPALCAGLYQSMAMRILVLGFMSVLKIFFVNFAPKLHRTIKVLTDVYKVSVVCDSKEFYF
jgi:hypothetical protein